MTRLSNVLVWAALFAAGCGVKGSGDAATEQRPAHAAHAVEISGALTLDVRIAPEPSLSLSGDDNLLPLIETRFEGDRLIVKPRESIRPELDLVVRLTTPALRSISASGATSIRAEGLSGERLDISLSGASDIQLRGEVGALHISASGAAQVEAATLKARDVVVSVSGAGDVDVTATDTLKVRISGAGDVTYGGNPRTVDEDISGAGSVSRR